MASNGWFGSTNKGGTSFMGSMFSGMSSAKPDDTAAQPAARSPSKKGSRGLLGQCEGGHSVTHDVENMDAFGLSPLNAGPPAGIGHLAAHNISGQQLSLPQEAFTPRKPAPKGDVALETVREAEEMPPWLMTKVDEYITEHFYHLEAKMTKLQQQVCELAAQPQKKDDKVKELLHQVKLLLDLQIAEAKKGLARDNETKAMVEQFDHLLNEVRVTNANTIKELKADMEEFQRNLEGYGETVQQDVEASMKNSIRQSVVEATYKFEADLMVVRKSFSSLRLEFNKGRKGQDFKNCSTSVFLVKAMDMKPEERKQILRTLSEQEDKFRGAVTKAEADLRDHERGIQGDTTV